MKYLIFLLSVLSILSCSNKFDPEISISDIKKNIEYLASDSLNGRKPGDTGDLLTTQFIHEKFKNTGLKLLYNEGIQSFKIVTEVELGDNNSLNINNNEYTVESDFSPYSFSANTEFAGEVVFAGYGLNFEEDSVSWNDYHNIDVEGKWVLVLKGDPEIDKTESVFIRYSDDRSKVLAASDYNAGGILLVGGSAYNEKDELAPLFYDKNSSSYDIPVVQITRILANEILKNTNKTIDMLAEEINSNKMSNSFAVESNVAANVNIVMKHVDTQNVVAMLPGNDPVLKNEYVIIGGHHDHLGMGGQGSGSRAVDTIAVHNGADDNASGVAAIIELAEKAAFEKINRRSLIFVTFGAEEMGLIGSRAFTNDPPVDLEKVTGMFNFDMVGRLDTTSNALSISGTKTSVETEELLNRLNPGFSLSLSGEGTGPSDHSSFYLQSIPVFFISTGAHSDYHTPNDDANLINYEGVQKITSYSYDLINEVANRNVKLTFQEAGSVQRSGRSTRYKLTLGVMPDFAGVEKRGMRIDAVTKDKPAYKGGMLKGDIITAMDGKKVGNIYDYMSRLNTLEVGQTISVDVLRDDKKVVLIIQL